MFETVVNYTLFDYKAITEAYKRAYAMVFGNLKPRLKGVYSA